MSIELRNSSAWDHEFFEEDGQGNNENRELSSISVDDFPFSGLDCY